MPNEITLTQTLLLKNGTLTWDPKLTTQNIDQAVPGVSDQTQTIPTSATAINVSTEIATLGVALIKNLDETNYIQIGLVVSATFYPFARIKPTEAYPLRLEPGVTYYGKAHTASVKLRFAVLND
jgi:hypothetical protein